MRDTENSEMRELTAEEMEAVTGGNAFLGALLGWAVGKVLDATFGGKTVTFGEVMDMARSRSS